MSATPSVDSVLSSFDEKYLDNYNFKRCVTRVNGVGGAYAKEDVVAALIRTDYNIGKAAQLVGRRRSGLNAYINRNHDVLDFVQDALECVLDDVEQRLRKVAMGDDATTGRWFLETRGKTRGYTKRQEVTGPEGKPIQTISANMSPEEAAKAYQNQVKGK